MIQDIKVYLYNILYFRKEDIIDYKCRKIAHHGE